MGRRNCRWCPLPSRVVTSPTDDAQSILDEVRVRYLVTRAALRAAVAMTQPGVEPERRLETLMHCHGAMQAARGPTSPLSFGAFRRALTGNLATLLPDGVAPLDLDGTHVVDEDGLLSADAFDLDVEQQILLHTLRKLGKTATVITDRALQSIRRRCSRCWPSRAIRLCTRPAAGT